MADSFDYTVQRPARSRFVSIRGLRQHLWQWGEADTVTPDCPALLMLHGWMDVGASFQFLIDALWQLEGERRCILALDWRGFGQTAAPAADSYWFPDYLGDLDALLDSLGLDGKPLQIDLLGHSMGGNVAMIYAGVRPERIRRLISVEGFGLPQTRPSQAPGRYVKWLDSLRAAPELRTYPSVDAVAERLRKTNPLLAVSRSRWLATQWARERSDGRWEVLADPAHRRPNPVLYRSEEVLACWERIAAPLLWVEGDRSDNSRWQSGYPREEFEGRLALVKHVERHRLGPSGHMVHHDQPEALAAHLQRFLTP